MKIVLNILILASFLFISDYSLSQTVRSDNGSRVGTWRGDTFRDNSGKLLYRMDNNGNVRDDGGRLVLRVSGNQFRDSSGRLLGRIDDNGTVRNSSGAQLGRIQDNGDVRDSSGRRIGSASGMSKTKAAVTFFFWE